MGKETRLTLQYTWPTVRYKQRLQYIVETTLATLVDVALTFNTF